MTQSMYFRLWSFVISCVFHILIKAICAAFYLSGFFFQKYIIDANNYKSGTRVNIYKSRGFKTKNQNKSPEIAHSRFIKGTDRIIN